MEKDAPWATDGGLIISSSSPACPLPLEIMLVFSLKYSSRMLRSNRMPMVHGTARSQPSAKSSNPVGAKNHRRQFTSCEAAIITKKKMLSRMSKRSSGALWGVK